MIACANSGPPRLCSDAAASSRPARTASTRSRGPITPVDAGRTSIASTPSAFATAAVTASASTSPGGPVPAFAWPLFATIARAVPSSSRRRQISTGAAANAFRVNSPAADAGASESRSPRSGRPLAFSPAATPDATNPRGEVTLTGTPRSPTSPSASSRPSIRFMFCRAWPAAPFPRLSIAPITTPWRGRRARRPRRPARRRSNRRRAWDRASARPAARGRTARRRTRRAAHPGAAPHRPACRRSSS